MSELSVGQYGIDIDPFLKGLDKMAEADGHLTAQVVANQSAQARSLAKVGEAAQQSSAALAAIVAETRAGATAQRQFAGEIAGLVKEIRDQAAAQDAARKAGAAAAEERRKATQAAKEAAKAEKQAAQEAKAAADAAAKAAKDGQGFFAGLISKVSTNLSGGNLFSSLLTSATAATAGFFAFSAITDKIKQGLDDFAATSGVQATLRAVAGSAAAGAAEFVYIKGKADELGLSLIPTAKAYTGLYAAAKEANIPVAQTRAIFEGVAGAAKVLNLSADDTNGVLLALQQIASKGTVAAEELRGQIGERLPGAFGLAAKSMGLTTAELGKQLQAGKVLASDFLPKFAAQLKTTYGAATADAATQVGSNMGRINTFFAQSSARLGATFAPAIAAFAEFVSASKTTAQVAQSSSEAYFRQADAAKTLVPGIQKLLNSYDSLNTMSDRSVAEQKELETTIQKLAKAVPGAVTEFDKYGVAIGISGDAIRKFLKDQENLTAYLNRSALKDNSADLRRLLAEQASYQQQVALLNQTEKETGRRVLPKGGTAGGQVLYYTPEETAAIVANAGSQLAQIQKDIDANLENRQRLRGKSPLLPVGDDAANDKAIQGLIEKQELLIKDLKDRQKKATDENQGKGEDFLFGTGGLNKQLEAAEKELDRLQGKVDKAELARENKAKAALEAYRREQQAYKELALKAAEQQEDDAKAASEKQFQLDLTNIYEASRKLKAAKKAAGQGGELDPVQREQENTLIQGAYKAHYDRLLAIQRTKQDQLLALEKEGDDKQLHALDLAFEREKEKYQSQPEQLKGAIEKYGRDKAKLLLDQEQKRLDEQEKLDLAVAESAALDFSDPVKAEEVRQQGMYAVKLKYALKEVDLKKRVLASDPSIANQEALKAAQNAYDALAGMQKKAEGFDLYKFILGKADSPELRKALDEVVGTVASSLASILQTEQQAAQQRAADASTAISELQATLSQELAYREEGSASNIAATKAALAEQREIRKQAQKDQREAAKEQVILDAITQAGNLVTSISNIFAGTSKLDAVLPGLGIATGITLSTVLVGAFAASKIKAYQAANEIGGSFFTGGFTPDGGKYEEAGTVHKGEFVANQELTRDYRPLFAALHEGRPQDVDWSTPAMQQLLPDFSLPGQLRQEKAEAQRVQVEHSFSPLKAEFGQMHQRLEAIEKTNAQMAQRRDSHPTATGFMLIDPETQSVHHINT